MNRLRRGIERFLMILDSEGVALFQAVVYVHLAVAAAYCLIAARGTVPVALQEALGPTLNWVWLWLCLGVMICLAGKLLSRSEQFWRRTCGLYLQLAGDMAAAGAFFGYVFATMQETSWGKAVIAVWVFASLGDCAALLVWRDVRRIVSAERLVRR